MAYPSYSSGVREALLARVRAGARVSHVCAEAGMPDVSAVNGWARRDAGFAARLAEAKACGQYARSRPGPAVCAEILRRLGEEEPLDQVLRAPGMPTKAVYAVWRREDPAFGAEVARLNRTRRENLQVVLGRRRWRAFDRAVADKVIVRVSQGVGLGGLAGLGEGLPGPRVVERWRRCDEDFDQGLAIAFRVGRFQERRGRRCTPKMIDKIFVAVAEGASLAAVARRRGMPCRTTLYGWMRTNAKFRAAMRLAREARGDWCADQALMLAQRPGWEVGRGRAVRDLMAKADRLAARARGDGR